MKLTYIPILSLLCHKQGWLLLLGEEKKNQLLSWAFSDLCNVTSIYLPGLDSTLDKPTGKLDWPLKCHPPLLPSLIYSCHKYL